MNSFLIVGGGILAAVSLGGWLIWLALKQARDAGAATVEASIAKKEVANVEKAGAIIAEHRSDDDTINRLQSGSF